MCVLALRREVGHNRRAMRHSSDRLPTASLLHRATAESRRIWHERSADPVAIRAVLEGIRAMLLRLRQDSCCACMEDNSRGLCAYEERLEHIGCPYVEADEYEGPELLSAAAFALRDCGVIGEDERVRIATVVMDGRAALRGLAPAAFRSRQQEVILRKEAARQDLLRVIAEVLGEDVCRV